MDIDHVRLHFLLKRFLFRPLERHSSAKSPHLMKLTHKLSSKWEILTSSLSDEDKNINEEDFLICWHLADVLLEKFSRTCFCQDVLMIKSRSGYFPHNYHFMVKHSSIITSKHERIHIVDNYFKIVELSSKTSYYLWDFHDLMSFFGNLWNLMIKIDSMNYKLRIQRKFQF